MIAAVSKQLDFPGAQKRRRELSAECYPLEVLALVMPRASFLRGLLRAGAKRGLSNLVYNMSRFAWPVTSVPPKPHGCHRINCAQKPENHPKSSKTSLPAPRRRQKAQHTAHSFLIHLKNRVYTGAH